MSVRFARILAPLLAAALVLVACGGADDGGSQDADTDADAGASGDGEAEGSDEPIVIGGTLGLTGAFAEPSAGYLAAYEYWEERINEDGGLLGRPVEVLIYDDESTPSTAQDLYQRLVNEDDVDLLLAPYTTAVGGAIIPVAERNEMVLWNGGFVGLELFENSDWIVGSYTYQEPDYTRGLYEMIESLPEEDRPQRVGIVTAQNPFTLVVTAGHDDYPGAVERAEDLGMEVVMNEEYPGDVTDVSALIQTAESEDVELFVSASLPNDAALIARTAEELGFSPDIYCVCGSQVTTLPFWKDLGAAGEGITGTAMAWETDDYPEFDELLAVFQEEFGWEEMPSYGAVALSILQVLEQSVEGAGTLDQQQLRDYVTGASFETANGTIQYDENRIPEYNAIVVQFVDGGNEVVWPEERATAEIQVPMP